MMIPFQRHRPSMVYSQFCFELSMSVAVYIFMGALQWKDHSAGSGNLHWVHSNSSDPVSYIQKYQALPSEIDTSNIFDQHELKVLKKAVSPREVPSSQVLPTATNFELYHVQSQGPRRGDLYFFLQSASHRRSVFIISSIENNRTFL
jgi:hypothetical protein